MAGKVQKRLYYKIGEACKLLDIQPYVLRYWETEFPELTPGKSKSGQRVYGEKELTVIRRIKELLYDEGYTIAGAKKKLEGEQADGELQAVDAPAPPPNPPVEASAGALDTQGSERIENLRQGIAEALEEAREILVLLEPRSS